MTGVRPKIELDKALDSVPVLKEIFEISKRYEDFDCKEKFKCSSCKKYLTDKCPYRDMLTGKGIDEDADEFGSEQDCLDEWEPIISEQWNKIWRK